MKYTDDDPNYIQFRIRGVTAVIDDCVICEENGVRCNHIDLDFRGGHVCEECSGFVLVAEHHLHKAGLSIPTDSILEAGQ